MINHAFRFAESVVFVAAVQNRTSQRALEKIGAVREGEMERNGRLVVLFRVRRGGGQAATWTRQTG